MSPRRSGDAPLRVASTRLEGETSALRARPAGLCRGLSDEVGRDSLVAAVERVCELTRESLRCGVTLYHAAVAVDDLDRVPPRPAASADDGGGEPCEREATADHRPGKRLPKRKGFEQAAPVEPSEIGRAAHGLSVHGDLGHRRATGQLQELAAKTRPAVATDLGEDDPTAPKQITSARAVTAAGERVDLDGRWLLRVHEPQPRRKTAGPPDGQQR